MLVRMSELSSAGGRAHRDATARRELLLELVGRGLGIEQALADPRIAVSYSAYRQWRQRWPTWAAKVDVARAEHYVRVAPKDMTSAQFALRYFGRVRAPFQQIAIDRMERLRPGNILLMLWPPGFGKTTTFEDYATEKLCRDPEWRSTVASEGIAISKKIVGRVRKRLEPDGPYPNLVADWGPFSPDHARQQTGSSFYQPWNDTYFNVAGKRESDERDYNMLAIGWKGSTVSIRTERAHCDDLQSTKTLTRTTSMLEWFRQDLLSRPGEQGSTSVAGARVGPGDIYEALEEDDELDGIIEVLKFRAIVQNPETGEDESLWPEKFSLDALDRIRRKIKDEAFDRNYMMAPGQSRTKRTFTDAGWAEAQDRAAYLNRPRDLEQRPTVVVGLDPGLDPGKTTIMAFACYADRMELIWFAESDQLQRNEEIVLMLRQLCNGIRPWANIATVRIEAMNFQRGLARDERLLELKREIGFTIEEHLTGSNKYDENIGVASMAGDWENGKIRIPYVDDPFTRREADEIWRQLKSWRPLARGTKLRQDRVMAMWFAWIWWAEKRHAMDRKPVSWKRAGVPWGTKATPSLIIPIGVRL